MSEIELSANIRTTFYLFAILASLVVVVFSFFIRSYIIGAAIVTLIYISFYLLVPSFISFNETAIDISIR